MSIRKEYFDYLSHFGETVTLAEFSSSDESSIALRHDIDHCIDVALEMAYWEFERGIKATYFILDTAPYFSDSLILEKCAQIQEFGHEIGIHLNSIARWFDGGPDPYLDLQNQLQKFRGLNINLTGTSAHGDSSCYKNNFINYWLFKELKSEGYLDRETKLNAEGIFEPNVQKRINSKCLEKLTRQDGAVLNLWGVSQKSLGLLYEASHLDHHEYFTDSGGSWSRSSDPLKSNLKDKRVQVLIHPVHWQAPRRLYFFMSTARSGSKWLATILDKASSCVSNHEYTLNHFDDNEQVVPEKMTGDRLHELLDDDQRIAAAFQHTRDLVDRQKSDYAEVNVYLPLVLSSFKGEFLDAQIIHLHRSLFDVVKSIMRRGWYDTPYDTAHPVFLHPDWNQLSVFEKCCRYTSTINWILINNCEERMSFEKMTTDQSYLRARLKSLGIAYYPLLAKQIFNQKINVNKLDDFLSIEGWGISNKSIFKAETREVMHELGYLDMISVSSIFNKCCQYLKWYQPIRRSISKLIDKSATSQVVFDIDSPTEMEHKFYRNNLELSYDNVSVTIAVANSKNHAVLLLNGGAWGRRKENSGWKMLQNGYYVLSVTSSVPDGVKANLFCLYYGSSNELVYKRALGTLIHGNKTKEFSFAAMANSKFFNLAVYIPKQSSERQISISTIGLRFLGY